MKAKARSLSGKIFTTVLAFTLGVIVVMSFVLACVYYYSAERDGEARLMAQARNAAAYLNQTPSNSNVAAVEEQFAGLVRFTLIAADGSVLYDSAAGDASALPNHADRPEVLAARSSGEGAIVRFSETIGADTVYAALLLDDGSVVRLAETRDSLLSFMGNLTIPIVASLVVAAALVFALSRMLTRRIMKPIDVLDLTDPLENDIYEEMTPLLTRIDEQRRQLKAQNEELARAENLRRDFSANVSHEMKTPLQVISGYAELMKDGMVPPEDTASFAGLIYNESQAMRSLINDVLTLSFLDEAAFDSDAVAPVEISSLAQRTVDRLATLAAERDVTISVKGERAFIDGNETLLEEMLYNLVENGIRYNHCGGFVAVTIEVECDAHPLAHADRGLSAQQASQIVNGQLSASALISPQQQVLIRVRDNGPGIPPEARDKIFERFYRMEKSRSKETGGTGLGLAIVKHVVLYHNGTIEVESEQEQGATFVIRFPAAS